MANQTEKLRAAGGDVRVSFGGASGSELGLACTSVDELAAAYGKVVDTLKLTKVDFDIEGSALPNKEANTRRAQAIAKLQQPRPGRLLHPSGAPDRPHPGRCRPRRRRQEERAEVSAVNIMAMDYAASFDDDMGQYAIDAPATATQGQIKGALEPSDDEAWKAVAVTPMIGVNDVKNEIFKVDDASQVVEFAKSKGLAWLSMWSATRDKQCPSPQDTASPTCSSIDQEELAFTKAFGAYNG
ncbi:GH18 domain-containing protein OS=Streptomyces antimycoticus OX=68175 GN=SSPO_062960 PE=4 SV=1 [Streptomyces antimycoticus]